MNCRLLIVAFLSCVFVCVFCGQSIAAQGPSDQTRARNQLTNAGIAFTPEAFHKAVVANHATVTRTFLAAGMSPDSIPVGTLRRACKAGANKSLDAIWNATEQRPSSDLLLYAIRHCRTPTATMLIGHAGENARWFSTTYRGNNGVYGNDNLLHIAVSSNKCGVVDALMEAGVDPLHINKRETSPLHQAIINKRTECLFRMLDNGVNLYAKDPKKSYNYKLAWVAASPAWFTYDAVVAIILAGFNVRMPLRDRKTLKDLVGELECYKSSDKSRHQKGQCWANRVEVLKILENPPTIRPKTILDRPDRRAFDGRTMNEALLALMKEAGLDYRGRERIHSKHFRERLGVAKGRTSAASWNQRSLDQGHAVGQNNLGYRYQHGIGVPQDYAIALSWYQKSAAQGYEIGQKNLGIMYENGYGVAKNLKKAKDLYTKAAAQGNTDAKIRLRTIDWQLQLPDPR